MTIPTPTLYVAYHHWCGTTHEAESAEEVRAQERDCETRPMVRDIGPLPHPPEQCDGCRTRRRVAVAEVVALINEELRRLPAIRMPEEWRGSLVHAALLRLRAAVEEIPTTG